MLVYHLKFAATSGQLRSHTCGLRPMHDAGWAAAQPVPLAPLCRRVELLHLTRSHEQQQSSWRFPHGGGGTVKFALTREAQISMSTARSSGKQPRQTRSCSNTHRISSTICGQEEPMIRSRNEESLLAQLGVSMGAQVY